MGGLPAHATRSASSSKTPSVSSSKSPSVSSSKTPSVSLFTGIGGIALGLGGVSDPAVYCDNDEAVRSVLERRIAAKDLPSAPIVSDVRELRPTKGFRSLVGRCMVEGGFPCQGLSLAGRREGLSDDRSGLFFELMRVASDFRAKYLFLENVAFIVQHAGVLDVVADELKRAGYSRYAWVCINAHDASAPCRRDRWFCLAVRDGSEPPEVNAAAVKARVRWLGRHWTRGEPGERMEPRVDPLRMHMLGNAAIPAQVCAAWHVLTRLHAMTSSEIRKIASSKTPPDSHGHRNLVHLHGSHEDMRCLRGDAVSAILAEVATRRPLDLLLLPDTYVNARSVRATCKTLKWHSKPSPRVSEPIPRTWWPSPRTFNPSGCRPSLRTVQDLGTVVAMERGTPDAQRAGWVSARFAEWLMGFGANWTVGINVVKK